MASGLSPDQADCLAVIRRLIGEGASPSYDLLAAELGLASKSSVYRLVCQLRDRGAVDWIKGRARSLYVIDDQFSEADLARMSDEALKRVFDTAELLLARRGFGI